MVSTRLVATAWETFTPSIPTSTSGVSATNGESFFTVLDDGIKGVVGIVFASRKPCGFCEEKKKARSILHQWPDRLKVNEQLPHTNRKNELHEFRFPLPAERWRNVSLDTTLASL